MVLSDVKKSGSYHVRSLGGDPDLSRHLVDLGFVPGQPVSVVSRMAGDLIVNVKGARVALSKELARHIVV